MAIDYAKKHEKAVKRAGIKGNSLTLGINLFRKILESRSGLIISKHEFKDLWKFIKNDDHRIHLQIDEVLGELHQLKEHQALGEGYPFILMAGERRSYNANQIFRNPEWRKVDKQGALKIHPDDALNQEIKLLVSQKQGS